MTRLDVSAENLSRPRPISPGSLPDTRERPTSALSLTRRDAAEAFLLSHLDEIESIVTSVCRRCRLGPQDAEDLVSEVKLLLIERDYAVLRRLREASNWRTFLRAVAGNKCSDFLNQRYGRWRPSRKAERLGRVAVELEKLRERDRYTLDEAIEAIRRRFPSQGIRALRRLAQVLPNRTRRSFVGEDRIRELTVEPHAERALEEQQARTAAIEIRGTLSQVLNQLEPEGAELLRWRFCEGLSFAAIARKLRVRQRSIYTRWNRCKRQLRRGLEKQGVTAELVRKILDGCPADLRIEWQLILSRRDSSVVTSESSTFYSSKRFVNERRLDA